MIYYLIFFIVFLILKLCIIVITSTVLVHLSNCLVNVNAFKKIRANRKSTIQQQNQNDKNITTLSCPVTNTNHDVNNNISFDAKDHWQYIIQLNDKLKFNRDRHKNYYTL